LGIINLELPFKIASELRYQHISGDPLVCRAAALLGTFLQVAGSLSPSLKTTGTIALLFDDKQPEKCAVFQRVALRKEYGKIYEGL